MKTRFNQKGFATWELALGVLVIAVIAFAGYHVYSSRPAATTADTAASTTKAAEANTTDGSSTSVPTAPTITDTSGLDQATAALNQTDPSASNANDSSQLSSQADF